MERREEQIHHTCKDISYTEDAEQKLSGSVRSEVSDACRQRETERKGGNVQCTIWRNLTISSIGFFLKPCGEDQTCVKWSHKTSDFLHLDPWHVIRCRSKDIPSVFFFPSPVQVQIHADWWSDRIHTGRANQTWQTLQANGGKTGMRGSARAA